MGSSCEVEGITPACSRAVTPPSPHRHRFARFAGKSVHRFVRSVTRALTAPGDRAYKGDVPPRARLVLLGALELERDGEPVPLPASARRLLAFTALHGRPLSRVFVAGTLWLDSESDARAAASLRSALWRLHRAAGEVVRADARELSLAPWVEVDLHRVSAVAHEVLAGRRAAPRPGAPARLVGRAAARLVRRVGRVRARALPPAAAARARAALRAAAAPPGASTTRSRPASPRCAPSRCARAPTAR